MFGRSTGSILVNSGVNTLMWGFVLLVVLQDIMACIRYSKLTVATNLTADKVSRLKALGPSSLFATANVSQFDLLVFKLCEESRYRYFCQLRV